MTNDGFDANVRAKSLSVTVSVYCTRDISGSHVTWIGHGGVPVHRLLGTRDALQAQLRSPWEPGGMATLETPPDSLPRLPLCLRTEVLTENYKESSEL